MVMSTTGVNYTGSIPELNTSSPKNEGAPSASTHPQRRLSLQNIHDLAYANSLRFRSDRIGDAPQAEFEKMLAGNDPVRRSSVGSVHTLVNADTQRAFIFLNQRNKADAFASESVETIVLNKSLLPDASAQVPNKLLFPPAPAQERHVTFAESNQVIPRSTLLSRLSVSNSSDVSMIKAPAKTGWLSAVKTWFHDHGSTLKTIAKVIAAVVVLTAVVVAVVAAGVAGLGTPLAVIFVAVVMSSLVVGGAMAAHKALSDE
ncbi:MAG: hypothetical protein IT497_00360 [Ottowia sp.]|nr:hypothetical protein [Ottowia sp.]